MTGVSPRVAGSGDKATFRLRGRSARQGVLAEERPHYAQAAAARLLSLPELARSRTGLTVLAYGASPEELDPAPAIAGLLERDPSTRIAYPRVSGPQRLTLHAVSDPSELIAGSFGLKEPAEDTPIVELHDIDLVIVPGVAFDVHGRRIGHGGGYYDRLLPTLRRAKRIGYAFDGQVFPEIPSDDHDAAVDVVVTPTRTLRSRLLP